MISYCALAGAADGFVYWFMTADGLYLKVGTTSEWQRRLKALQTAAPQRLLVVAVAEIADPGGMETWFHQRWRRYRTHGEWFRVEGEVAQFVDAVMAPIRPPSGRRAYPDGLSQWYARYVLDQHNIPVCATGGQE